MAEDKEYLDNPQEVQDKEDEYEKWLESLRSFVWGITWNEPKISLDFKK